MALFLCPKFNTVDEALCDYAGCFFHVFALSDKKRNGEVKRKNKNALKFALV